MSIQLRTLGELDLRGTDRTELRSILVQPKRIALLTYLAVATPHGFHRRDALLALLWPERDTEHARGALRQVLYSLRRSLGEGVVVTRGEDVGLGTGELECDVRAFEEAVAQGANERAAALYRGPFLAGFYLAGAPEFEQWVEAERTRLDHAYAGVLERLAEETSQADPGHALQYWELLARQNPYCSRIAVRLMQALEATGDAPAAIRHAERHAALLREELDAEPDPQVGALAERLRREPAALPVSARTTSPARVSPQPETVGEAMPARAGVAHAARFRWGGVLTIAVLLLLVASGGTWLAFSPLLERPVTLAVLPFVNEGGDAQHDFLASGLTDAVISDLGMIEELRVTSRGSLPDVNDRRPLQEIASELGVEHVVRGGMQVTGERMRLAVELIEPQSSRALFSREYNLLMSELSAIHDDVARDLAAALRVRVPAAASARLSRLPTVSVRAYELYLRGRYATNEWNEAELDSAIAALEAAVAEDSSFAAARAALANAYLEKGEVYTPDPELRRKAYVQIEMAVTLDPGLAEAYVARGNLLWTDANSFPHEAALREYRHAVRLQPSLSAAHDRLAHIYTHIGLLDEALAEARIAVGLDPQDFWARFRIGYNLATQQRYREAEAALRQLPEQVAPVLRGPLLAESMLYLGRPDEAARLLDQLVARHPRDPWVRATRALVFAVQGDTARARAGIAAAAARVPGFLHGHHAELLIGTAWTVLGQADSAVYWLRRAAEEGYPCYPRFAGDPLLEPLRGHAPFEALLRDLRAEWNGYRRMFAEEPTSDRTSPADRGT